MKFWKRHHRPLSLVLVLILLLNHVNSRCRLKCETKYVEDCERCHKVHARECSIEMQSVLVPQRIRECGPSRYSSSDGSECSDDGSETICNIRYETECGYRIEYQEVTEDHPECRTEKVEKCFDDEKNLFSNFIRRRKRCFNVDVRKCSIVKKTLRKAKPVHQCKRVPRRECSTRPCSRTQSNNCREYVRLMREERPREECRLRETRICERPGVCRRTLRTSCDCHDDDDDAETNSFASEIGNSTNSTPV